MLVTICYLCLYKIKKYPIILTLMLLGFYFKCILLQTTPLSLYILLIGGLLILSYEDYLHYAIYVIHLRILELVLFLYLAIFRSDVFLVCIFKFIIAFGIVYLYSSFFYVIYHKKGMGEGDYEIIAMIYMCTTIHQTLLIIWLSCVIGIVYLLLKKKQRLPFIPFLTITSALILA